jgi:membrane protease YdiL (CAAX protease family)
MNILILLAIGVFCLCLIWAVQSIVLKLVGEPLAWPFRFKTRDPLVRWTVRVMVHVVWIIILVVTPLALDIRPLDALHQAFPTPVPWRDIAVAFSIIFFPCWLVYGLLIKAQWVRIEPQHDQATRRRKLFRRFLGPLPLATLEEAVFRGVLLEQLLRSFPQSHFYTLLAIVLSSAVFSAAHFIKPQTGKPIWQPAYGLFIVGCLFGLAYVVGGRSLWLPIVVHATFVFIIQVMRLYSVHQAPPWQMGYSEWPQSGVVGTLFISYAAIALVFFI